MDYKKIYQLLIKRGQDRNAIVGYSEKHHIVPRCLGGDDSPTNLVKLTPEEHYVAHQLLSKIYPDHCGLAYAAMLMCVGRSSNKLYGWVRRRFSKLQSIRAKTDGPSCNKRWVANEFECLMIAKEELHQVLSTGQYIVGKKAVRAECGHLVRDVCIPCRNAKRKAYDLKKDNAKKLANELFDEFKLSHCTSVGEFAKVKNTSQPRLSLLWKKYVLEYAENRQHGKRFFK